MSKKFSHIFYLILLLASISCTTQKKMIYLQGSGSSDSTSVFNNQFAAYKIHVGDLLYIKILSLNKEINTLFNFDYDATNSYAYNNEISMYYKGYTVTDDGKVDIPVLGKIEAKELSLDEFQKNIQQLVDSMLKDAKVIVKYGGFKFTVLGEVKRPGLYYYYNNRLTVFDALGEAGDLTDMGNRENILIVRPTQNGSNTYRINLLDKNLLQDSNFYINPNDVIYIEPIRTKNWKLNASNISIILSSITTTILVINFILRF